MPVCRRHGGREWGFGGEAPEHLFLEREGTVRSVGIVGSAIFVLAAIFSGSETLAQSGGLRVRVLDADGAPLPGAIVVLTNRQQFVAPTTETTRADGRAEFPILRPGGGYSLQISFPSTARQVLDGLRVRIGESPEIVVRLTPEIREQVEVTAKRDVVSLDETAASTKFSDAFIEDLPVQGRFYQNVLTLAPGVLDSDEDGNPNVHGARARDFKTTVGGVSNVDPLTGQWLSYVNPESIDGLEVITAGAGAEFGRAQGGFAQIVQKQGANQFEGVLGLVYASSRFDGSGSGATSPARTPNFESVQPLLQLSGPIVQDRLWFLFSHEYIRREDPVDTLRRVEVSTRTQSIATDQITWQVSPRNKLAFQYQKDPTTLTNVGVTTRFPAESSRKEEIGGTTWRITWTAAQSPRLLVESLAAYQDGVSNVLPSVEGVPNDCLLNLKVPSLDQSACFWTDKNAWSGSYPRFSRDRRQRLTVSSRGEVYAGRFLGSSHRLKFGFTSENERYYRQLEQGPTATFTLDPIVRTLGVGSYRVPFPTSSVSRITGANWSVYFEDQFRPTSGLSFTLGARLDREGTDSLGWQQFDPAAEALRFEAGASQRNPTVLAKQVFTAYQDVGAFQNYLAELLNVLPELTPLSGVTQQSAGWQRSRKPSDVALRNTNVAPRVAVAWDPGNDGKTKLFATAGRYYDKVFLAIPLIEVEPETVFLDYDARKQVAGEDPGESSISTRVVDRDLRTPFQDEWSAGVERELWSETSLKVYWLARKFQDQFQDRDLNHLPGDYGSCKSRAPWVSTQDGPDGLLDDCWEGPDGFTDLYVQNPGWGDVLEVGNFNSARYRAFVTEFVRRQYRGWQMEASYTWSKAEGQAEDFDQLLGNDPTTAKDEEGFLAYDQRHAVKVNATTVTPWGVRLGGRILWESGLPYSVLVTGKEPNAVKPPPLALGLAEQRDRLIYPSKRRNDQRNEAFWTFDAQVSRDWTLRRATFSLTAEVFNLLNDHSLRLYDVTNDQRNGVRRFGRRWQLSTRLSF